MPLDQTHRLCLGLKLFWFLLLHPEITGNVSNLTVRQGLPTTEAMLRLKRDGPNALPSGQRHTLLHMIWETAREPMFLLLFAARTLYIAFGEPLESVTLFGAVLVMFSLTLYQEGKTERAMEALREPMSPQASVIRDGQTVRIAGKDVAEGNVILLAEDDRIPADGVLLEVNGLRTDESLLTGGPVPVRKVAAAVDSA